MRIERNDLQRCVWCNFEATLETMVTDVYYTYCDNCGASGPSSTNADYAVSEWNRIAALRDNVEKLTSANSVSLKLLIECDLLSGVVKFSGGAGRKEQYVEVLDAVLAQLRA